MTSTEKLIHARQLARLGVDVIEVGFSVSSSNELDTVCSIFIEVGNPPGATAPTCPSSATLSRCNRRDTEDAWEAGRPDALHLQFPYQSSCRLSATHRFSGYWDLIASEKEAGDELIKFLYRSNKTNDSSDSGELEVFHMSALKLGITSSRAALTDRRTLKKLIQKAHFKIKDVEMESPPLTVEAIAFTEKMMDTTLVLRFRVFMLSTLIANSGTNQCCRVNKKTKELRVRYPRINEGGQTIEQALQHPFFNVCNWVPSPVHGARHTAHTLKGSKENGACKGCTINRSSGRKEATSGLA
ncbi:U-box domain-containing protein 45 [Zea mays]|uniref:U-box domain-containing protein 45 n=1 Tax=Zea mays TaxID=4577 RepID=A0A3L6EJ63_MAIZE|nr:U-box domain-containing protein 45 [Zea mays]